MATNEIQSTVNILWRLDIPNNDALLAFVIADYQGGHPISVGPQGTRTDGVTWTSNPAGMQLTCTEASWQGSPIADISIQWTKVEKSWWEFVAAIGTQNPAATGSGSAPQVCVTFTLDADGILIVGEIDTDIEVPTA
jgi:hypothetical protein